MNDVLDTEIEDTESAAALVISVIGAAPKAITTDEAYEAGMSWLAKVVSRRKRIEAFFEKLKKPIRLSLKTLGDTEKGVLAPLEFEEASLKRQTGGYFMKKRAEAEEKQRLLNAKQQAKVEAAVASGKPAESVAPARVVEQLPTTIKGATGQPTATMRIVKAWRMSKLPHYNQANPEKIYRCDHPDLVLIPDVAWVLDTARANSIAKSGMSPALELYDVPSQAIGA